MQCNCLLSTCSCIFNACRDIFVHRKKSSFLCLQPTCTCSHVQCNCGTIKRALLKLILFSLQTDQKAHESFTSGSSNCGAVFRALPVYRVSAITPLPSLPLLCLSDSSVWRAAPSAPYPAISISTPPLRPASSIHSELV